MRRGDIFRLGGSHSEQLFGWARLYSLYDVTAFTDFASLAFRSVVTDFLPGGQHGWCKNAEAPAGFARENLRDLGWFQRQAEA